MQTEIHHLSDDGEVPNNETLPLIIYHDAFGGITSTAAAIDRFANNGWQGAWVNGIFDFHHYHARSHEVLANLGAAVTVQFGGRSGPIIEFMQGSVVVIPAGCGHCRLSGNSRLTIVGAYPVGQEDWDLKRAGNAAEYNAAKNEIPDVTLPPCDPVTGGKSPLLDIWRP